MLGCHVLRRGVERSYLRFPFDLLFEGASSILAVLVNCHDIGKYICIDQELHMHYCSIGIIEVLPFIICGTTNFVYTYMCVVRNSLAGMNLR